jgi:hypothetical protein
MTLAALALSALPLTVHAASTVTSPTVPSTTVSVGTSIDRLAARAAQLPVDRRASLARQLRALGPSALAPMVARLQQDSTAMKRLHAESEGAYAAFRLALVDALGYLRDTRAAPALKKEFEAPTSDARLARVAAEGLGRLCDASLAPHGVANDPREQEAYAGLSLCRKETSANVLLGRLESIPPEATAKALANAIGMLGSSWAWEAMGSGAKAEGDRVRAHAATVLLKVRASYSNGAKDAIEKALLMVDHPSTSQAVSALPATDSLRLRWTRSHAK